MLRAVGVVGVVALALASCKKPGGDFAEVMKAFEGFATAMCACKDKACADHVQEAMTKWSTEMAENAGSHRQDNPDEAALKAMTDLGQKYGECMTKLLEPVPAEPPTSPEPPPRPPVKVSVPADRPSIATLINEAKAYTYAAEDHLAVHVLQARYVRPDGALDPTHGELTIGFGNPLRPPPTPFQDDPDRLTGAPIPEPPPAPSRAEEPHTKRLDMADCPVGMWSSKSGWSWSERTCNQTAALIPRCSTAEVWQRARAKNAPDKALAYLELNSYDDGTQRWKFEVTDALRKVDIDLEIEDTCAAVVEKP